MRWRGCGGNMDYAHREGCWPWTSRERGWKCRTVVRHKPDCVKSRLFLVPWGTVAEKRLEPSRAPYCPLISDSKWDTCPFCFRNLGFSHSLKR